MHIPQYYFNDGKCRYCDHEVMFHDDSSFLYNGKNYGPVWACSNCDAHVGCHIGSSDPYGEVADQELRNLRRLCRKFIDYLWQKKMSRDNISKTKAKKLAYAWLEQQLKITPCHAVTLEKDQCVEFLKVCEPYVPWKIPERTDEDYHN